MDREELKASIQQLRKRHDPLITDVLRTLDWKEHIERLCKKHWVDCRDDNGNHYTLYPVYDTNGNLETNKFQIVKY